ncbi:MAG TPA: hypothetical protein DD473_09590 [Planctomycetaceae bacterium]|nr:hypothetical protein [Planctomycetaceae bacterium]
MSESSSEKSIEIIGARVHNLQNVSVTIPLHQWTALAGVSGSGKSSLAFDTLHAESQRRYFETLSTSARNLLDQLERPDVDRIDNLPATIAIGLRNQPRFGNTTLSQTAELDELIIRLLIDSGELQCPQCRLGVRPQYLADVLQQISQFPEGMRFQVCIPVRVQVKKADQLEAALQEEKTFWENEGFHRFLDFSEKTSKSKKTASFLVIVDRLKSEETENSRTAESVEQALNIGQGRCLILAEEVVAGIQYRIPISDERDREWHGYFFSSESECPKCDTIYPELEPQLFRSSSPVGACPECSGRGIQVTNKSTTLCEKCEGTGLREVARLARFLPTDSPSDSTLTYAEIQQFTLQELNENLNRLGPLSSSISQSLRSLLQKRIDLLLELGLASLQLKRLTRTLSQGEFQRVVLMSALNTDFVNTLYLFDEPTNGLHPADRLSVVKFLRQLVEHGNTVLTIEHHSDILAKAESVIELGHAAGKEGGTITYQGTVEPYLQQLKKEFQEKVGSNNSDLSNDQPDLLQLTDIHCHYLKGIDVQFPLKRLTVVTGVCGSGKSSLICDTLYPILSKLIAERGDQKEVILFENDPFRPDGKVASITGADSIDECVLMNETQLTKSSRSTPATYLKVFDDIRKLFAETVDAQSRGYTPSRFSFNSSRGGRCSHCEGLGFIEMDMQFLANLTLPCTECHGSRFQPETLKVSYRNRNIHDVLSMTADEAFAFFRNHQSILRKLQLLRDVGLGYLTLGQSTATLSRGESQRLKLASYLNATSGLHQLFLFDEPASGLHPRDIETLLQSLKRLVEQGHTVIVIEHNARIIQAADWVIDLGIDMETGESSAVYSGSPSGFRDCTESLTARYLDHV